MWKEFFAHQCLQVYEMDRTLKRYRRSDRELTELLSKCTVQCGVDRNKRIRRRNRAVQIKSESSRNELIACRSIIAHSRLVANQRLYLNQTCGLFGKPTPMQ